MVAIFAGHMDARRDERDRLAGSAARLDGGRELLDELEIGVDEFRLRVHGRLHLRERAAQRRQPRRARLHRRVLPHRAAVDVYVAVLVYRRLRPLAREQFHRPAADRI